MHALLTPSRACSADTLELKAEKQSAHSDCISSVAFSPDGKTIVSGSDDKTIKVWDAGDRFSNRHASAKAHVLCPPQAPWSSKRQKTMHTEPISTAKPASFRWAIRLMVPRSYHLASMARSKSGTQVSRFSFLQLLSPRL